MTREKYLCDKLYQSNFFGKQDSNDKVLRVTIDNAKNIEMHAFEYHAPEFKYVQNKNIFLF